MKIGLVPAFTRTLALLLLVMAGSHNNVEAGKQCKLEERPNLQVVRVQNPARILLETGGVRNKEDCYKACCHAHSAGCNAAAFFLNGKVGVCQLLKCNPFKNCIWKASPHSTVGRIRGATLSPQNPAGISLLKISPGANSNSAPAPKNQKNGSAGVTTGTPTKTATNQKESVNNQSNISNVNNKNARPNQNTTGKSDTNKQKEKKDADNKINLKKEEPKKSKGFFESIKDFLLGIGTTDNIPSNTSSDPKGKTSNQTGISENQSNGKAESSGSTEKKQNEVKNINLLVKPASILTTTAKARDEKVNPQVKANQKPKQAVPKSVAKPKPMTKLEREQLIERERARQKALERQAARQKEIAETRERQLARARQRANEIEKRKRTQKTAKKVQHQKMTSPTPKTSDDFNIIPLNEKPAANQNAKSTKNAKLDINNNNNNKQRNNISNSTKQNSGHLAIHPPQIPRPPIQQNNQKVDHPLNVYKIKKGQDQLFRASFTTLLVGVCAVSLLALLVMLALCRKIWGKEKTPKYKPLKTYDEKEEDPEQTETLLNTGPRQNLHSI